MNQSRFLAVGNWKANKSTKEIDLWVNAITKIENALKEKSDWLTIAIAPPLVYLDYFKKKIAGSLIQLAAQDVSMFQNGSYTGEVTAKMLTDVGTKYVLVGHSERRKLLNESPVAIERKISQAIREGIVPIIGCQNFEEIPATIRNYLPEQYILMYEPFEAISTDAGFHPVTPEKINQVINDWLAKLNMRVRIVYGGSVTKETIIDLVGIGTLEGVVIGRESLEAERFSSIIEAIAKSHN